MDEILVSTNFGRGRPVIAGLGSQFVVVWADQFNQNLTAATFSVSGQRFSDDFQVNTTAGIFGLPAVAAIPLGFVVAWISSSPPPAKVLFQRFGGDGKKKGPETVVNTTPVDPDLERIRAPALTMLANGNFVVSWVAVVNETLQVRAAIFNGLDGHQEGGEIAVSDSSPGINFSPQISAFFGIGQDDVAFVVTWQGGDNGIILEHFQLFDETGKKLGGDVAPRHSMGEIGPVTVPPGSNDPREIIGVLGGIDTNQEQVLTARLFVRSGDSLLTNITHVGDNTVNFDALVTALPNGRAVVTWTQKLVPTTGVFGNNVAAAILEVEHQQQDFLEVLPGATRINTSAPAGQNSISAAPLLDDFDRPQIAFVWVDAKIDGGQRGIKARVLSGALT